MYGNTISPRTLDNGMSKLLKYGHLTMVAIVAINTPHAMQSNVFTEKELRGSHGAQKLLRRASMRCKIFIIHFIIQSH